MRERFTRRCAAHRTALFERAEGYRLEEQSRESGLWCSTSLPGTTSGHWASRWIVWDEGDVDEQIPSSIVAISQAEASVSGEYAELDEDFFSWWLSAFEHMESLPKRPRARREQAKADLTIQWDEDEERNETLSKALMVILKPAAEQMELDWFAEGTA